MIIYSYSNDGNPVYYDGSVFVGFLTVSNEYYLKSIESYIPYTPMQIDTLGLRHIQEWHKQDETGLDVG
tara:strand:+ start:711 stop:917 length:207 start_codon:yes stop_codon:yes gene_type:complete